MFRDNGYPRILTRADLTQFQTELDATKNRKTYLQTVLRWSYNDPDLFNTMVLGGEFWSKQKEMSRLVVEHDTTVIVSGNSLGKSYWEARIVLWYLYTRPNSIVVTTAPTASQLSDVLWKYIKSAHAHALYPLGGKITSSPNELLQLGDEWMAIGRATTKADKVSGYHTRDIMVVVDEASGISPDIWEGLDSLNCDKMVVVGNPIRSDSEFFNLCSKAQQPGSSLGYLKVSSLESPHIHDWRSEYGLACLSWIEAMKEKYGEGSSWWGPHILAEFPTESMSSLFKPEWLDMCKDATHIPSGHKRISVDYAEGGGGDLAVIMVRDDGGIYEMAWSNQWPPDELARQVALLSAKWEVHPSRIGWDASGTGSAFGHFLLGCGLVGCRPYKGSFGADKDAVGLRLRDCAAWAASRRLDPSRTVAVSKPGQSLGSHPMSPYGAMGLPVIERKPLPIFAIPAKYWAKLRPELGGLRYEESSNGKIKVESGESYRERLGRSPDFADCFCQSFAFSH